MTNTTFYVFRLQKCAFSEHKNSINLLKKLPQICTIRKIEDFPLKLLFFEIFRRGKISRKIRMKKK